MAIPSTNLASTAPALATFSGLIPDSSQIAIPARALATVQGFREWAISDEFPKRGRVSFLAGDVYIDMSPEELLNHIDLTYEIVSRLRDLVKSSNCGRIWGDGALLTNDAANLSTVPDGVFVSWGNLNSQRTVLDSRIDHPSELSGMTGSPDWVLEVISRSSVKKDTERMVELYYAAGIREYWLVNAYRDPIDFKILRWQPNGYETIPMQDGWLTSPVFERQFQLTRSLDQLGMAQFQLHVRTG